MAARDAESMFSAATEFAATVFSAAKEFAPTAFSAAAECPPSELLVSPLERTAHGGTTTPSTSVPPWPSVQAHARFHHRRSMQAFKSSFKGENRHDSQHHLGARIFYVDLISTLG
jgi:hypothetical protein